MINRKVDIALKDDCSTIYNCHLISDDIETQLLSAIIYEHQLRCNGRRSFASIYKELKSHMILYYLGVSRQRTKDADIELNQPEFLRLGYSAISALGNPIYVRYLKKNKTEGV